MRKFEKPPTHHCRKESCPIHGGERLLLPRRWPTCLPETLLDRRPQSLPV